MSASIGNYQALTLVAENLKEQPKMAFITCVGLSSTHLCEIFTNIVPEGADSFKIDDKGNFQLLYKEVKQGEIAVYDSKTTVVFNKKIKLNGREFIQVSGSIDPIKGSVKFDHDAIQAQVKIGPVTFSPCIKEIKVKNDGDEIEGTARLGGSIIGKDQRMTMETKEVTELSRTLNWKN